MNRQSGITVHVKVFNLLPPVERKRSGRTYDEGSSVEVRVPYGASWSEILETAASALRMNVSELRVMTATNGGSLVGPSHLIMNSCVVELRPRLTT